MMQRGTAWQYYCKLQPKTKMNSDKKWNGWYIVVPWYIKNRQSNSKKVSSEYQRFKLRSRQVSFTICIYCLKCTETLFLYRHCGLLFINSVFIYIFELFMIVICLFQSSVMLSLFSCMSVYIFIFLAMYVTLRATYQSQIACMCRLKHTWLIEWCGDDVFLNWDLDYCWK